MTARPRAVATAATPTRSSAVSLVSATAAVALIALVVASGAGGASGAVTPRAVPSAPASSGLTSWTTYMGTVTRHNDAVGETTITVKNAHKLHEVFNVTTGGPIPTQPMVADGRLIFGSWDGYEYAANASNGSVLWKTYTGRTQCGAGGAWYGVTSSATVLDGVVYVGGGGPYWDAIQASTGKILWQVYTGNNSASGVGAGHYNWASPLIYQGNAYVGIASTCDTPLVVGGLWKVNLTSHHVVAYFNTTNTSRLGASIWGSPSVNTADGDIYVTSGNFYVNHFDAKLLDDSLIELNATNMTMLQHWHIPQANLIPDGDFGTTPDLYKGAGGKLMTAVINKDGILWGFNVSNISTTAWHVQLSTQPTVSPVAWDGKYSIFIGTSGANISGPSSPNGNVTNGTHINGGVWSLNGTTGKVNWVHGYPGTVFGPPIYGDGVVFAAGGSHLEALDAPHGSLLWSWTAPKQFYGWPTLANGMLYVGDNDGKLYAFTIGNGSSGPTPPSGGAIASPSSALLAGGVGGLVAVPAARPTRRP